MGNVEICWWCGKVVKPRDRPWNHNGKYYHNDSSNKCWESFKADKAFKERLAEKVRNNKDRR